MRVLRLLLTVFAACCAGFGFAQTQLILGTNAGASAKQIASDYGISLLDQAAGSPFALYSVPTSLVDSVEMRLALDARIAWFDLDEDVAIDNTDIESKGSVIPVIGSPSTLYAQNAGLLSQIGWNYGLVLGKLAPVRVAVLDTGLAPTIGRLWARVDAQANFAGPGLLAFDRYFTVPPSGSSLNGMGHGTMVAGLISQVHPYCRLVIARVADQSGNSSAWQILKGLAFAVSSHADIANVSLGTPVDSVALDMGVQWAGSQGLIVVAPAGNSATGKAINPARDSASVCVSGLDANNIKASFSNWDVNASVSAPAVGIKSIYCNGQMGLWSGTSFACPLVSGGLALAKAHGILVTTANAADLLKASGSSVDSLNPLYAGKLGHLLNVQNLCRPIGP